MDFARLSVGSTFRHVTWATDYIRVDAPSPMPSPNQQRADSLAAQFTNMGVPVPSDVQALIDEMLSVRLPEPAVMLNQFTLVRMLESVPWVPMLHDIMDRGFVLRSGELLAPLTEQEQLDALAAAVAGYSTSPEPTPLH